MSSCIQPYLDKPLRVGLTDGRVIVGTFVCFDKQRNILLVDAQEWRWRESREERAVGIVLVPWRWARSIHAIDSSTRLNTTDDAHNGSMENHTHTPPLAMVRTRYDRRAPPRLALNVVDPYTTSLLTCAAEDAGWVICASGEADCDVCWADFGSIPWDEVRART